MAQNDEKLCLSYSISQEPYIMWFSFMAHMCKMIISPGIFLIFSKFWFSRLLRGVKEQKIVQDDKKFCLLCSISQEPYIIWSSFVVHKSNIIISLDLFFHFFQNFDFWIVRRVKGEKMAQHYKKLCPSCLYISGTIHHMIFFYVTHVLKDNIPCVFVHFFQILIFGVNSWVKGQKMAQNDEKLSVALHTSGSIHHIIVIFGSHVLNNDISRCFFHFFSMIFQIVREVTGQKMHPSPPNLFWRDGWEGGGG